MYNRLVNTESTKLVCMLCECIRKKRKADGGSAAVASKKSKQETEEEKGLRVCYLGFHEYHIWSFESCCDAIGMVLVLTELQDQTGRCV